MPRSTKRSRASSPAAPQLSGAGAPLPAAAAASPLAAPPRSPYAIGNILLEMVAPRRLVDVDGVGTVLVVALTGWGLYEFADPLSDRTAIERTTRALTYSLRDPETNNPLYTVEHAPLLADLSSDVLALLAGTMLELSGLLGDEAPAAAAPVGSVDGSA